MHEYVNLYICAPNPMMLKRRDQHLKLCVLRVDTAVLETASAGRCFYSSRNRSLAQFCSPIAGSGTKGTEGRTYPSETRSIQANYGARWTRLAVQEETALSEVIRIALSKLCLLTCSPHPRRLYNFSQLLCPPDRSDLRQAKVLINILPIRFSRVLTAKRPGCCAITGTRGRVVLRLHWAEPEVLSHVADSSPFRCQT